jgi:hypothetical protein
MFPILNAMKRRRKRFSVTSHGCGSLPAIVRFLPYSQKHQCVSVLGDNCRYTRAPVSDDTHVDVYHSVAEAFNCRYRRATVSDDAHADVCHSVAEAFNCRAQRTLQQFCTGLPKLWPTVYCAIFMSHYGLCSL